MAEEKDSKPQGRREQALRKPKQGRERVAEMTKATEKTEATTRHRPAGATSTGDGEPLPGAEKTEATTRHRPAGPGATSTGDGEPKMRNHEHRVGWGKLH